MFHADDFGETAEITKGILHAILHGVVRSSSLLANMPATGLGIEQAVRHGEAASFGVHINLCEGPALSGPSSLTDETGRLLSKHALALRAFGGRLRERDVLAELEAQVGLIRDGGVRISHLDGHKHLHMLPTVRDAVVHTASRFGVRRIRVTGGQPLGGVRSLTALVREGLARSASRRFRSAGLRSPGRVLDVSAYLSRDPVALVERIARSGGVTEVVCHPGTEVADRDKPGSCARSAELGFLTRPELAQALEGAGVRVVSYWEV